MKTPPWLLSVSLAAGFALSASADPNAPTSEEMKTRDEWVRAHLLDARFGSLPDRPAAAPAPAAGPGLEVLENHDPVIPNSRGGKPLKINQAEYHRGLYCHANSKVVVRLPGPARSFHAVIGVDSNSDTRPGRGSVVFAVRVRDRVVFESGVMHEDTPAKPVDVDLAGADSFLLEVGDSGDGISCDQSDWADARVTLADGREVWLGDLPITDRRSAPPMAELARSSELPFAFSYDGKPSDALLSKLPREEETRRLDPLRTRHTLTWKDVETSLEVRCEAVTYADFPVVEWTVYFTNAGTKPASILADIQGLDARFERGESGEFLLHHWKGDTSAPDLYEPHDTPLGPDARRTFAPAGGRGTNHEFPYYDVAMPGGGVMLAIGWPGQWASRFARDSARGLRISAGQEWTHMSLQPGEVIRSPLIALLFRKGDDTDRAHNLWRRWMRAHNVPRTADGELPRPILFGNTSGEFNEMTQANTENQNHFIDRYVEERVPIDFWWMDAGWYPCDGNWPKTGTWEPDPKRFPNGLKEISDHARTKGVKTLVWFEPERVAGGTWLSRNHPEWLLGGTLLNLGLTAARDWLTDHVDRVLAEQGISLYRQDFNIDPLPFWRNHDTEDGRGATENHHVQNYLAYWDALRKRHPQLVIDSCASGGRRNDLETMRRAIALHPTDYNYGDLPTKQAFHYSLFQWLPDFGSNTVPVDTVDAYAYRSGHAMNVVLGYDLRRQDLDYDRLRALAAEWKRIVPCYFGDYYPLTPYNRDEHRWIAWQFHRPGQDDGVVEAFRRRSNGDDSMSLHLKGLDPDGRYEVSDLDSGSSATLAGRELMEDGLRVEIRTSPGATVLTYKRTR
jgi:alpha-galactosidase